MTGLDGYDTVEFIASQPWCNGAVSMSGNSWLATEQWATAIAKPPSLKCIAPWEAFTDKYRDLICRGGVPKYSFASFIFNKTIRGRNDREDIGEALNKWPLFNAYWEDKRPDMTKIECPVYISGSDFSSIHTMGSVRAWLEIPHNKKWIRWSSYQEWYELYCVKHSHEELQKYFDFYLKGEKNDWESATPKVRWSALQFGDQDAIDNIEYTDFPIPDTQYRHFHLSPSGLSEKPALSTEVVSYNSEDPKSIAEFTYKFPQKSRLIGLPKAILYMSCPSHDDMNVFIILRKRDRNGELMMHLCFPFSAVPKEIKSISDIPEKDRQSTNLHMGSVGTLRASHRRFIPEKSIHEQFPFHPHDIEEKITPGEIVKLEIGIWSMGVDFQEGESISVQVSHFN